MEGMRVLNTADTAGMFSYHAVHSLYAEISIACEVDVIPFQFVIYHLLFAVARLSKEQELEVI